MSNKRMMSDTTEHTTPKKSKPIGIYHETRSLLDQSREVTDILAGLVTSIKHTDAEVEVDKAVKCYEECVKRVDSIMADLKQQLENDELAEMVRKRAEMEEKERKEREEKAAIEEEKILRRQLELERENAQKAYETQLAEQRIKEEAERAEEAKQREKEERDRLDAMVSTRLATSDGVVLVAQEKAIGGATHQQQQQPKHKYDLTNWKYADLRDAINTISDMDFLVACKEELHLRLRVYNDWKAKNTPNRDVPSTRAPLSLFNQQSSSSSPIGVTTSRAQMAPHVNPALTQQRHFKVAYQTSKNVKTSGICVRPMPETLCRQNYHQEVEAAVNKQVNIDLYASYVYLSMSFYFDRDDVALPNIAKFFKKQSDQERDHATELMRVQNLRGGRLVLQDIQKPEKTEWESALKAFEAALALERANNESLLTLQNVAGNHNDAHLTGLIEGKYLDEQVRSINEFARYVTTLRRVGPGVGEFIFDKEFKD